MSAASHLRKSRAPSWRGRPVPMRRLAAIRAAARRGVRTLAGHMEVSGIGLHTGARVRVVARPAAASEPDTVRVSGVDERPLLESWSPPPCWTSCSLRGDGSARRLSSRPPPVSAASGGAAASGSPSPAAVRWLQWRGGAPLVCSAAPPQISARKRGESTTRHPPLVRSSCGRTTPVPPRVRTRRHALRGAATWPTWRARLPPCRPQPQY